MKKPLQKINNATNTELRNSLLESEQRLKYHLENSPLAVVEWIRTTLSLNGQKRQNIFFGWSKDEVIG